MLVLSRKRNESIIISIPGYDVSVKVLDIGRRQVGIGIEADRSVNVVRSEKIKVINAVSTPYIYTPISYPK